MKTYKPREFAQELGVSVKTLQRWDRSGVLKAHRTLTDRRYYTQEQLFEARKASVVPAEVTIYARAFEDETELKYQLALLREEAEKRGFSVKGELSEMGSAYEFCRPKFCRLLKESKDGNVKTIFIAHPVSLTGFGYSEFEKRLANLGVNIISLDDKNTATSTDACKDFEEACKQLASKLPGIVSILELLQTDETPVFPEDIEDADDEDADFDTEPDETEE